MSKLNVAALDSARSNPNAQKFLDFISSAEGTRKHGYATAFGGSQIGDLSRHPGVSRGFTQTDGKKNTTTAAGKYQFIQGTWNGLQKKLGLQDFGPRSQDLGALELIREKGALSDVLNGDFQKAIGKLGGVWASLPSSNYAQPKKGWDWAAKQLGQPFTPGALDNRSYAAPQVAAQPSMVQPQLAQPSQVQATEPLQVAQAPQVDPMASMQAASSGPMDMVSALASLGKSTDSPATTQAMLSQVAGFGKDSTVAQLARLYG